MENQIERSHKRVAWGLRLIRERPRGVRYCPTPGVTTKELKKCKTKSLILSNILIQEKNLKFWRLPPNTKIDVLDIRKKCLSFFDCRYTGIVAVVISNRGIDNKRKPFFPTLPHPQLDFLRCDRHYDWGPGRCRLFLHLPPLSIPTCISVTFLLCTCVNVNRICGVVVVLAF